MPSKILEKIDNNKTILEFLLDQLSHTRFLDKVIIATTTFPEDDSIEKLANSIGIPVFKGNSEDVLDRYYQCANKFGPSNIVRITSDNPFIDPEITDTVISEFFKSSYDYGTNFIPRTFPYGTEVEIFTCQALEKAWNEAKKPSEREHVTPYFYNNPNVFRILKVKNSTNLSNLRWTVDRLPDLKLVRTIASKIKNRPILMKNIIDLLSKEPQLIEINKECMPNEGYRKSLKLDELDYE